MAPANNQPLLSDGKKLTIAGLALAGLFLLCYGTGESTVVIAGLGVLVGLGGPILIIVTTSRASKRTYVFGTAHVHDVSGLPTAGNTGRIQMQLIINARGIDGVPVMMRDNSVPANKWPDVGATLPVRVLESNPSKVTVLWEQVRTHGEVSRGEQRFPGFSPPSPRGDPEPVSAPPATAYAGDAYSDDAYRDGDGDDPHALADEDDYDDGPLPPDDRPTRSDLPPIRVEESGGGSPVAVMDRQQVVEISPTPGSSYPGYPYEEHATYAPNYPATPTAPPDESEISPFELTPQDLPSASASAATSMAAEPAQAASRVSSRRRPSPYRRRPGNRPSTRPTASAPFRTAPDQDVEPDLDTPADQASYPDVDADTAPPPDLDPEAADTAASYVPTEDVDETDPEPAAYAEPAPAPADTVPEVVPEPAGWVAPIGIPATADRETDWAPPARPEPAVIPSGPVPAADPEHETGPTAREAAWAEIDQPATTDWPEPTAREDTWPEPVQPDPATGDPNPPGPTARGTAWAEPGDATATDTRYADPTTDPAPADTASPETAPVDTAAGGTASVDQSRTAWNNGWARTAWPHSTRPETAPEEPDLPDGLDSDDEALEGGVFDPSGYATDSPDDRAAHIETMDDSYAMPSVYGLPEGGADGYVPDPFVSEIYDPEPDYPAPHEEINGHAVEIVAPPTEPYRPDGQPSPIDELFAPWPEPQHRPVSPAPEAADPDTAAPDTADSRTAAEEPPTAVPPDTGLEVPPAPRRVSLDEVIQRPTDGDADPADALEPEPDAGGVARFMAASPREAVLPMANPTVHGISVTLQVSDLQRSRRFYKDKLGLQELDSSLSSAVLESGDARVLLRQVAHMPPVDRRSVHLHLEVPDVYEAYERLRADGVEFIHRPRVVPQGEQLDLCTATFRDPDGHAVEISRWELHR